MGTWKVGDLSQSAELLWTKDPAKSRRTIKNSVRSYASSAQILGWLKDETRGWKYRVDAQGNRARDVALIALIYLLALRESEATRIKKGQFQLDVPGKMWKVVGIELSKVRSKSNPKWRERHDKYREGWLPLRSRDPARRELTSMVIEYAKPFGVEAVLFPMTGRRVQQIVTSYTEGWPHYFRMAGLNYLYEAWGRDVVALSRYVKIDVKTLMHYLGHRTHEAI